MFKALRNSLAHTPLWMLLRGGLKVRGLDGDEERLASIEGQVPNALRRPVGCKFADRCPFVIAKCRAEDPPLMAVGEHHLSACWRAPLDPSVLVPPGQELMT